MLWVYANGFPRRPDSPEIYGFGAETKPTVIFIDPVISIPFAYYALPGY